MTVTDSTKPSLRADAARNRERVLGVARQEIRAGNFEFQLNDVARRAGLGVGTVYRHFPTPKALLEAAVRDDLRALVDAARQAMDITDTDLAIAFLLRSTLGLQLRSDGALGRVLSDGQDDEEETSSLKVELAAKTAALLRRAHRDKIVRRAITADDIISLMCGLEFAVRANHSDDPKRTERYLQVLLQGLRPPPRPPR